MGATQSSGYPNVTIQPQWTATSQAAETPAGAGDACKRQGGKKAYMSVEQARALAETLSDTGQLTDEKVALLRQQLPGLNTLGISISDYASLKVSIELLAAVRRFDKASGDLVNTTNVLTKRILWITVGGIFIGMVQLIVAIVSLYR